MVNVWVVVGAKEFDLFAIVFNVVVSMSVIDFDVEVMGTIDISVGTEVGSFVGGLITSFWKGQTSPDDVKSFV